MVDEYADETEREEPVSDQINEANSDRVVTTIDTQTSATSSNTVDAEARQATPGDVLRTLPTEAQRRGTRFVSAQAMQAKLFSVYDAAAAAEDALALVQEQLTLTLNRSYYDAEEIESMAAQLDSLLLLESIELPDLELDEDALVSED